MATLEQIEELVELGYLPKKYLKTYRDSLRRKEEAEKMTGEGWRELMADKDWERYKEEWLREQEEKIKKIERLKKHEPKRNNIM